MFDSCIYVKRGLIVITKKMYGLKVSYSGVVCLFINLLSGDLRCAVGIGREDRRGCTRRFVLDLGSL